MKNIKVLLVLLISGMVLNFPLSSKAQNTVNLPPGVEVKFTTSGSSFRLIVSDSAIRTAILKAHLQYTRVQASIKEDRFGYYWLTTFYFPAKEYQKVYEFFKNKNY